MRYTIVRAAFFVSIAITTVKSFEQRKSFIVVLKVTYFV